MISVIIPCYKGNDTIRRAVMSALNQTYQDVEVIVIDNNRTLDRKLLKTFNENIPNVRVYSFDEKLSAAAGRNFGISAARGEYVAFLDADDYWREDKLEKQLKVMKKYKYKGIAPVICFSGRAIVDSANRFTGKYFGCDKIVTYEWLLRGNQINCSSVIMRKDVAERFEFPEGDMHEDFAMWLDILRHGSFAVGIDQPLLRYRMSAGSKSGNKLKSFIMTFKVYMYEGLSVFETLYYMCMYVMNGIKKYFF